jgi:N-acetylglutamate synthase-like GNAT family acetyltransferase
VHPDHQGRALGVSLIASAIAEAESLALPAIVAYTTVPAMGKRLRQHGFSAIAADEVRWGERPFQAELFLKRREDEGRAL